jgi:hypothetical protein
MGLGISLVLIAVGSILNWAVTTNASGFDVNAVGLTLMAVGGIGLVLAIALWSTWWGPSYFSSRPRARQQPTHRRGA